MSDLEIGKEVLNQMLMISTINGSNHDFDEIEICDLQKKDSISFYFEMCEDNNDDKYKFVVNRFHFDYAEYKYFFESDLNNKRIEKIDIKTSSFKVTKIQLIKLIEYLFLEDDNRTRVFYKEKIRELLVVPSDDELIEKINMFFYKFYYDLYSSAFRNDRTSRIVNYLYYKCIGNRRQNYYDYRPERRMEDIDNSHGYALRVYDVGQGNSSALIKYVDDGKKDYEVIMVFDFGLEFGKKNTSLNEMINKIDYQTKILISHFDMDHINNVINRTNLMTPWWIFPNYTGKGVKANKFFAVLLKVASNKTFSGIVPQYHGYLNLSNNIMIYQNTCLMDPNQSTKNNAECLVSTIITRRNRVLIPADSLYEEFDTRIANNNFDYVLIPHHCCKYDTSKIIGQKKIDSIIRDNTKGIALSGKNSYGHTNINHLLKYPVSFIFPSCKIYDDNKNDITSKLKLPVIMGEYFEIEL